MPTPAPPPAEARPAAAARATGSVPWVARIGPGGPARRAVLAAIALISAAPTLVWAATGASFLHDDWGLAATFTHGDAAQRWHLFWSAATHQPARPGAALYYAVSFGVLGTHPVLHALLLAAVCGALGVLMFLVTERLWRTDLALWITLVYVVLPNRGSDRLWFAVATDTLAVVLVLAGALLLLRGRPVLAGIVLAAATLTYEGVFGVALLAVAVWVAADLARRWRTGLVALAPVVAAGALLYELSPKRKGSMAAGGLDRLISSQFGVGTFEWGGLARFAPLVLGVGLVLMVALPHRQRERYRTVVLAGVVLLLAGWAPFFLTNWPIASDGFFDRANVVVGLGTAVLMGAFLCWLAEVTPTPAGTVLGVGVVVLLLSLNAIDVQSFRQAARDGHELLDHVVDDVPVGSGPLLVVPPPGAVRGVAQFPAGSNLGDALWLRRGDRVTFWIDPSVEEEPAPADASCYDPVTRTIGVCAGG